MAHLNKLLIILMVPFLSGCAVAAITAAGASLGVSYTITNIACKTLNFPLGRVDKATVKALKKMDMSITAHESTGEEKRIIAAAKDLDIRIKLEPITSMTTKMNVDARKGPFLKDRATALEIIHQVCRILDPNALSAHSLRDPGLAVGDVSW